VDKYINLRSDTVTLPTKEMIDAIAKAELGDDVKKEDITTNKLEEYAAELLGKEAALFVTSGTMGNLVSIMSNTPFRKSEIIAESHAHIITSEAGGYAHIAGVAMKAIDGDNGALDPDKVENLIRDTENVHHPRTALICMENTHNAAGGTVISLENMEKVRKVADKYGVAMHLDGARIFNAALALNVNAKEIAKYFDSVQFCLSKGLSAPFGSIVVGSKEFIKYATHMRKIVGGGMRQCGIMAAAGYVALTKMTDRLVEDHENAKIIAEGLCNIKGITLDMNTVQTNMVRFDTSKLDITADELINGLKSNGILAGSQGKYIVRFVTHRHISREDAMKTIKLVGDTVNQL
jgi:threonine aldolase